MKIVRPKGTPPDAQISAKGLPSLSRRVREILESARWGVVRTVNTTHFVANQLIGHRYSVDNLEASRLFYLAYPSLISEMLSRNSELCRIAIELEVVVSANLRRATHLRQSLL